MYLYVAQQRPRLLSFSCTFCLRLVDSLMTIREGDPEGWSKVLITHRSAPANCRTAAHTAALPHCCTLPHCHTLPHTVELCRTTTYYRARTAARTAAHCCARCRTLLRALPHIAARTATHCWITAHCHTLPRTLPRACYTLPHCPTLPHTPAHCRIAGQLYTAARTATHCSAYCCTFSTN
jgi:hypothetical protein